MVMATEPGVRLAPFTIVKGQNVKFNVYHQAEAYCRLELFYTTGFDWRVWDSDGEPIEKVVLFVPGDLSHYRQLTLDSEDLYSDRIDQGPLRLQAHAVEFDPSDSVPSPSPPIVPSDCQVLRLSVEVYDRETGQTDYYFWGLIQESEALEFIRDDELPFESF